MQPGAPPYSHLPPPPPPRSSSSTVVIVLACVFGGIVVVGIAAAVAIPAFMDTMKKSKRSEVDLSFDRLWKSLGRYVSEEGHLPPGSSITPDVACCDQPGRRCAVNPTAWSVPPWSDLDFEIDEPSYYQYDLRIDGDRFEVNATGDLDCDGIPTITTLRGHLTSGILVKDGISIHGANE